MRLVVMMYVRFPLSLRNVGDLLFERGINIGFWCHTPQVLLGRAVGRKHAMMMLATGALFPADHALRIGLVNAVHPVGELDAAIEALARTIASKPASVLRTGKRSFGQQSRMPVDEAYDFVQGEALRNIVHPDAVEGISAFLEKRPPRWYERAVSGSILQPAKGARISARTRSVSEFLEQQVPMVEPAIEGLD